MSKKLPLAAELTLSPTFVMIEVWEYLTKMFTEHKVKGYKITRLADGVTFQIVPETELYPNFDEVK